MAEPSLQLGNGNWAGKSGNLLAYHKANNNFYADELTFTRASTGTIVNSDGLIEQVPYNLIRQSNQFDTTWTNSNTTETSGQSGYDGSNDAWLLDKSASNAYLQNSYVFNGSPYTFSTYLKSGSKEWGMLFMGGRTAFFNLSNGTKGFQNGTSSSIEPIGNGWYRCSLVFNYNGSSSVRIYPADGDNDVTGTSGSIYIQDAQLNSGSTAKTYYPTTTRLNVPRVDYLNNTNGSLLLESQRTNLNTYSEDIPQNYVTTEMSDTFEYSTSPNGLQTSTRLQLSNVGSSRYVQTLTGIVSNGTTYTFSCYYKGTLGETAYIYALPVGGTPITPKAITFTGEWQRENLTFTAGASSNYIYIVDSRQGGDASDFQVWGAQVEEGSYATSYIPTSGTTVTRLGENSSSSVLPNIVDDFTFFVDFVRYGQYANSGVYNFAVKNSTDTDRISIYKSSSVSNLNVAYKIGGVTTVTNIGASVGDFVHHKIAFVCNGTTVKVFKDGSLVDTKTGFLNSDLLTDIHLRTESISTTNEYGSKFRSTQFYLSALTDTELATLTTI